MYYGDGKFSYMEDNNHDKRILQNAHLVVTEYQLWNWLSLYKPKRSFIMNSTPEIIKIKKRIEELNNHLEFSEIKLSFVMTIIYYISKNGYDTFEKIYTEKEYFEII
jgi:hypothetical protein